MKAIWTGSISFGLVNLPIRLFSAIEAEKLDLDLLDKKDHSNIRFKRVNERTGKEVAWQQIVKGMLVDDAYVILTDKDLEMASPKQTKQIEIRQFIDLEEIDAVYYETPYFALPDKSGMQAYALLRDALKKTGKAGIGSFVLRTRESPCAIRSWNNILLVHRLRFASEIRSSKELDVPAAIRNNAQLKMATDLIAQMTDKFDIRAYKDTYTNKLMKLIKERSSGKQTKKKAAPLKVVHSKSTDLMAQLKQSLSNARKKAS